MIIWVLIRYSALYGFLLNFLIIATKKLDITLSFMEAFYTPFALCLFLFIGEMIKLYYKDKRGSDADDQAEFL